MARQECDYLEIQTLCTKPTYWNTGDTWYEAKYSYYIRQGNIVTIFAQKSGLNGSSFLTLPIGYRPVAHEVFTGSNGGGVLAYLEIHSNGEVYGGSGYIWATGSFYTADPFPYSDI